ncbi:GDSL esterase/lipase At1g28600-like [Oryza brachyantha]|uniref:Esterase n=1 Tax=Oryza brachyantha TaxID=4533 RepID=J3N2D5_ORYBR|nr:GDSL esterase/lipase At1g28600-like [Oryza brachyantha]
MAPPLCPRLDVVAASAAALLGVLLATASAALAGGGTGGYARVFSFGDSLTDTGNALRLPCTGGGGPASRPPYGETFFRRPTGRASDGRLAVDFVVEALRLPHPAPYLAAAGKTAAGFDHGVNFAVAGSTALSPEFYAGRGLKPFVPVSLANQTIWFHNVVQLLGSSDHDRRKVMASSLFIVGEIGVNDYLVSLVGNLTVGEVESFVPHIVGAIRSVVNEVIAAGATTVVVPGMIPLGCEPQLLALYQGGAGSSDAGDYDPRSGCMARLNGLAERHNRELRCAVAELRRAHWGTSTSVVYADLYRAVTDIVVSPGRYGFGDMPLEACCGGAGSYNFNVTAFCGASGATACADPSVYVSWDGVHFTEAANRHIACAMLKVRPAGAAPPGMATSTTWPAAAEAGRRRIGC